MVNDDDVAQFCAVTSAEPDIAKEYLEVSHDNVEQALSFFFENGGAPLSSQRSNNGGDDSAAQAQAQAQPPPMEEDDDVRAPMSSVTEQLVNPAEMMMGGGGGGVGGGAGGMFGGLDHSTMGPPRRRPQQAGIFNQQQPRNVFDDSDNNSENDEEMATRVGTSNLTAHQSRLANLFKPPFDLIKDVDLETAKFTAHEEKKWVLANIMDMHDFRCQQLNRDLWSDKRVKKCVKQNFVFLQYQQDSPEGEDYKTKYQYDEGPHISILDPRTGEQLKVWDTVPEVDAFLESLYQFLSQFSLHKGHQNPVVDLPKQPKKVEQMTEEEQIEMAMRESMGLSTSAAEPKGKEKAGTKDDPIELSSDDMDEDYGDSDGMEWQDAKKPVVKEEAKPEPQPQPQPQPQEEEEEEEEEVPETAEDKFLLIDPISAEEPTDPKTTTRIQFRFSGGRLIRRFNLTDSVKTVFGIVKKEVEAVQGHYFSLTTPERKKLIEHLDETVESCNLKNSVVMIELED